MNNIEGQAKELLNKISSKVEEVTGIAPSRVTKSDKLKRWSAFIRVESPREEFLWSAGYPDDHGVSAIRIGTWVSHSSSDQQEVYDALETMLANQFPEHTVDKGKKGIALEIKLNTKADSQKLDENLLKIANTIQDLIPAFYELIDGKIVFNRGSGDGRDSIINETNDLTPEQSNFLEEGFWSGDLEDEEKVPKAWLKNKSFMLQVVTSSGSALEYASDELKSDRGIVLAAVKSDGSALEYASDDLKSDRGIVLAAVTSYGYALQYASDELKSEKEIVLAAVTSDGEYLQYASDELKSDREIVLAALAAVSSYGRTLQYASDELKSEKEIVLAAVKSDGRALEYASEQMLKSLTFIKDLCEILDWKKVIGSIPNHVLETADKTYIDFFEEKCKEGIEAYRNEINNLKLDLNEPWEYKKNLENIYQRHIPWGRYYESIFRWDGKINIKEGKIQNYGEDSAYEVLCNEFYQNIWQPAMECAELTELVKLISPTMEYGKAAFMSNRELTEWGYQRVIDFLDDGEDLSLEHLVDLLNAEEEFFALSSDLPEIHERLAEEVFKHSFQDIFEEILYNDYHWASSIFTKNRNRLEEFIEWIRDEISSTNDDKYEYPLENLLEWLEESEES
jgi:hypothetical protein